MAAANPNDATEKIRHIRQFVAGEPFNLQQVDPAPDQLLSQPQIIEGNHRMKTKLLSLVTFTALAIGASPICPLAFAQTDVLPTPTSSAPAQATPTQQMQGMDSNS